MILCIRYQYLVAWTLRRYSRTVFAPAPDLLAINKKDDGYGHHGQTEEGQQARGPGYSKSIVHGLCK